MIKNVTTQQPNRPLLDLAREEYVLRILGLEKTYLLGFWRRPQAALKGISFVVPRGVVFALLGHNGAGKTTTMKCILDLVNLDAGQIEVFGLDHTESRSRSRIGYLPEQPHFYEHLNGRELLEFYGHLLEIPTRRLGAKVAEVLDRVGMTRHARLELRKYSKGMLQRLGVAQAILNDPELLILDEPMSGLDPLGRREVRDLLMEMRQSGTTILLSSHIVPDVEALADSVVIIKQGQLHSVYEITGQSATPSFEVSLPELPSQSEVEALLAGCPAQTPGGHRGTVRVRIPDLPRLRRFLDICASAHIPVQAINTRETGLEDHFLAALRDDSGAEGGGGPTLSPPGDRSSARVRPADRTRESIEPGGN